MQSDENCNGSHGTNVTYWRTKEDEMNVQDVEDKIEEPRVGMVLNSLDNANNYYKLHAKQKGFGQKTFW